MKLGAVIIPATTLLGPADLARPDRRGADVRHVVAERGRRAEVRRAWPGTGPGSRSATPVPRLALATPDAARDAGGVHARTGRPRRPTRCCCTSPPGTTAQPKLVEHTHASYPVGHLSTMYWIGLQPGDVHLNISSPGWAKHAWSNVFAPWNAGATVLHLNYERFDAPRAAGRDARRRGDHVLRAADGVADADPGRPGQRRTCRRCASASAAGEPLNPEVIEQVPQAWGITIRDGFGQTETTAQVGNPPGPAGQARLDGPAAARLPGRAGRPGDRRAGRRGRDLPGPVRSARSG